MSFEENTVDSLREAFTTLAEFIADTTVAKLRGTKRERESNKNLEVANERLNQRLKCYQTDNEKQRLKIIELEKEISRLKRQTGEEPESPPLSLELSDE